MISIKPSISDVILAINNFANYYHWHKFAFTKYQLGNHFLSTLQNITFLCEENLLINKLTESVLFQIKARFAMTLQLSFRRTRVDISTITQLWFWLNTKTSPCLTLRLCWRKCKVSQKSQVFTIMVARQEIQLSSKSRAIIGYFSTIFIYLDLSTSPQTSKVLLSFDQEAA